MALRAKYFRAILLRDPVGSLTDSLSTLLHYSIVLYCIVINRKDVIAAFRK